MKKKSRFFSWWAQVALLHCTNSKERKNNPFVDSTMLQINGGKAPFKRDWAITLFLPSYYATFHPLMLLHHRADVPRFGLSLIFDLSFRSSIEKNVEISVWSKIGTSTIPKNENHVPSRRWNDWEVKSAWWTTFRSFPTASAAFG